MGHNQGNGSALIVLISVFAKRYRTSRICQIAHNVSRPPHSPPSVCLIVLFPCCVLLHLGYVVLIFVQTLEVMMHA